MAVDAGYTPIVVAALGVASAIFGTYLTFRGNTKATSASMQTSAAMTLAGERAQLAKEWAELRVFTQHQLEACRVENEALSAKVEAQEIEIASLRREVDVLNRRVNGHS